MVCPVYSGMPESSGQKEMGIEMGAYERSLESVYGQTYG